jgi:hypothetical protein
MVILQGYHVVTFQHQDEDVYSMEKKVSLETIPLANQMILKGTL